MLTNRWLFKGEIQSHAVGGRTYNNAGSAWGDEYCRQKPTMADAGMGSTHN